jgi:hypothetical protein
LKNDGMVAVWGDTSYGQNIVPPGFGGATAIAAGDRHISALVIPVAPAIVTHPVGGTVRIWDVVDFNVMATGFPLHYQWRKDGAPIAGAVNASYGFHVTDANQAGSYTVVIDNSAGSVTSSPAVLVVHQAAGAVVAWGLNDYGQTNVPAGLFGVTAIAAGGFHTVALQNDGTTVGWGANNYGQSYGLSDVTAIAAGAWHTVALTSDGTFYISGLYVWGETYYVPPGLSNVTAIAAGGSHMVALKNDGTVVAWGWNDYGQTNVPAGLTGVTAIAAGGGHTVALKNNGTVVAWGRNFEGQTNVPAGLNNATAIAAGGLHTVALKSDGTVVAWGYDYYGQTDVPAGLTNVIAIAAGGDHTVALKSDGTVVAWGRNNYGQTNIPAELKGVTAIAAGSGHTVALIGTGLTTPFLRYTSSDPSAIRTNGFTLNLTLEAGRNFRLQVSTNLVDWTDLTNITGTGTAFAFTDHSAVTRPCAFYRTVTP